ncbi:MAG: MFS transporter [Nannocystales bacterium]
MTLVSRNLWVLAASQALMLSGMSLVVTTAPLVGLSLTEGESLATLPVAAMHIATLLTTLPAAFLMGRFGRKAGFLTGVALGVTGAGVATLGVLERSMVLFSLGTAMVGIHHGFANHFRFAAADGVPAAQRSVAVSRVLAGGILAAVVGPSLAHYTWQWMDEPFAASYAALLAVYLVSVVVLLALRPAPTISPGPTDVRPARPLGAVASQPRFLAAVTCATFGYATMTLVMTATPLAMKGHGHSFADTASVIQWHILGMFAPSLITGRLIRRFGIISVLWAGVALESAAVALNLVGAEVVYFRVSLIALGVGWNFLFVGGTTLLMETYRPSERARAQGLNDGIVFTTVALATLMAGVLHPLVGWRGVNLSVLPLLLIVAVSIAVARRRLAPS